MIWHYIAWLGLFCLWMYVDKKVYGKPYILKNLSTSFVFWIPTITNLIFPELEFWTMIKYSFWGFLTYGIIYFGYLARALTILEDKWYKKGG